MTLQKRPRRRWSRAEKNRLVELTQAALSRGETWAAVCQSLDVGEGSLRLWMRQAAEQDVSFREVEVEPTSTAIAAGQGISMSAPDGFRFDGLTVDDAVVLWEMGR